jgi:hypothetical protein
VSVEEAQRLLRQLLGEPNGPEVQRPAPEPLSDDQTASLDGAKEEPDLGVNHAAAQPRADTNYLALQHEFEARELRPPPKRSRHGGALPE